jgi:hypothetical protein
MIMKTETQMVFALDRHRVDSWLVLLGMLMLSIQVTAQAQSFPDVRCHVEDYAVDAEADWQVHQPLHQVQVVVLRDPSGEQEARFDLIHGASLISLKYQGKELLFGHSAGADVSMYAIRQGRESELKGLSPYWSAFHPDQGGTSMRVPATTAGIACHGESTMRAFAMMIDGGVDNSFQRRPLIGVWKGRISDNFPPGYSTPYTIETDASWVSDTGGNPRYYLKLDQTVVNVRPESSGAMQWFLLGNAPWNFDHHATEPSTCTETGTCTSGNTSVIATGSYQDSARSSGFAMVVPTRSWHTQKLYLSEDTNPYGGVPVVRKRTFGVVLVHGLDGITGFHFTWYICAGSWRQAKGFAAVLTH